MKAERPSPDLIEPLDDRGASRGFHLWTCPCAAPPLRQGLLVLLLLFSLSCGGRAPANRQRDDLGRAVDVPQRVQRVVTLAPNLTELVFALGSGALVVGTDDFSDEPAAARSRPKVGGMQPDIEKIAALRPDLVLASSEGNQPALGPALAAAGIPLFVVRTDRLADLPPAMRRLGGLLRSPGTDAAVAAFEQRLAAEKRSRPEKARVLFAVWTDPLYVGGRETFVDDLIELAGAENAVTHEGWPQHSLESLIASPPDVIVYPSPAVTPRQVQALLNRTSGVHPMAVAVDEDLFTRPGPRVADAAAALNAILDTWERSR